MRSTQIRPWIRFRQCSDSSRRIGPVEIESTANNNLEFIALNENTAHFGASDLQVIRPLQSNLNSDGIENGSAHGQTDDKRESLVCFEQRRRKRQRCSRGPRCLPPVIPAPPPASRLLVGNDKHGAATLCQFVRGDILGGCDDTANNRHVGCSH